MLLSSHSAAAVVLMTAMSMRRCETSSYLLHLHIVTPTRRKLEINKTNTSTEWYYAIVLRRRNINVMKTTPPIYLPHRHNCSSRFVRLQYATSIYSRATIIIIISSSRHSALTHKTNMLRPICIPPRIKSKLCYPWINLRYIHTPCGTTLHILLMLQWMMKSLHVWT